MSAPDPLARGRPGLIVGLAVAVVAIAWGALLIVTHLNPAGLAGRTHLWIDLFNDRPVEWLQWFLLAATIAASGFLAGRLWGGPEDRAARFFVLISIGVGFMLIEEAGDIRHHLSDQVVRWFGGHIFGLPYRVVTDLPYFAVLALVPLYAVARHGRAVWRSPRLRPYLLVGYALYAVSAVASGTRHLRGWYSLAGEVLHHTVFRGRLQPPPDMSAERMHFVLIDGPVEESIELIAAACLLAMVVAFARDVAEQRLRPANTPAAGA